MGNNSAKHTELCAEIQLALGGNSLIKVFKNNAGLVKIEDRYIKYGLSDGFSDLLGFKSEVIDQTWIGKRVAVFFGIEAKTGKGRPSDCQSRFLEVVDRLGGYSGIARSVDDAWRILRVIR